MKPSPIHWVLIGTLLAASADAAITDGVLDPDYGDPLSTQEVQTSRGDTPSDLTVIGPGNFCIGSELDEAYGFIEAGVLHLFFSGNFASYQGEPLIQPDQLEVFIDCASGGQSPLRGDNPMVGYYLPLPELSGLAFDSAFTPDYWFDLSVAWSGPDPVFAFSAELPADGDGAGSLLGRTTAGSGALAGGTNPFAIQASINQSNRAGVTAGCDASSGAGVGTGIEWSIPLAALGNPTGTIKVCAMIATHYSGISNQVLGPLPTGTCSLGPAGSVNLESIPGAQYFTVGLAVPTAHTSWGRVRSIYR